MNNSVEKFKKVKRLIEIKKNQKQYEISKIRSERDFFKNQLDSLKNYREDYCQRRNEVKNMDIWEWQNLELFVKSIDKIIEKQEAQNESINNLLKEKLNEWIKINLHQKSIEKILENKIIIDLKEKESKYIKEMEDLFFGIFKTDK